MRKILFILLILIVLPICDAVIITEPVLFEIYPNTVYIIIYNQTATFFNVSSGHHLDIYLNGTHFNFTTISNKTITGISYTNDNAILIVNGTGILTTKIRMNNPSSVYNFFLNGVQDTTIMSDIFGDVTFNFTITDSGIYTLEISPIIITTISTIISDSKKASCNNISGYESITVSIFSIALMILGFGVVIFSIKIQKPIFIITGIMIVIFGFASILFGSYLLSSLFTILC